MLLRSYVLIILTSESVKVLVNNLRYAQSVYLYLLWK